MPLMRQKHRTRNGDTDLTRQRVVEKLIVGAPPEGIVDDDGAAEDRVLQPRPVERDVLRDAVDDDAISGRLGHAHRADPDMLGHHPWNGARVDAIHQRRGKRVFHAIKNADLFHGHKGSTPFQVK